MAADARKTHPGLHRPAIPARRRVSGRRSRPRSPPHPDGPTPRPDPSRRHHRMGPGLGPHPALETCAPPQQDRPDRYSPSPAGRYRSSRGLSQPCSSAALPARCAEPEAVKQPHPNTIRPAAPAPPPMRIRRPPAGGSASRAESGYFADVLDAGAVTDESRVCRQDACSNHFRDVGLQRFLPTGLNPRWRVASDRAGLLRCLRDVRRV